MSEAAVDAPAVEPEAEAAQVNQEEEQEEQEEQQEGEEMEVEVEEEPVFVPSVSGLGDVNVVAPLKSEFSAKRPRVADQSFRASPYSSTGVLSSRLFVGNLDYGIAWQTLKDHFKIAGDVSYAKILTDRDGSSKGCGIVEFRTPDEASVAIKMLQGSRINNHDRPIYIREDGTQEDRKKGGGRSRDDRGGSRGTRDDKEGRQIFVDNLPYTYGWQDLKDTFSTYGVVEKADIQGERGGRGIVLFSNADDAARAIASTNGLLSIEGRRIYTKLDGHAYKN